MMLLNTGHFEKKNHTQSQTFCFSLPSDSVPSFEEQSRLSKNLPDHMTGH